MSSVRLGDAQNNLPGNVEMCIDDYHHYYMTSGLVTVCRDAEVLSLFAAIINKLKDRMQKEVPKIFEAVFQVTLQMITKDFSVSQVTHHCGCIISTSTGYRLCKKYMHPICWLGATWLLS